MEIRFRVADKDPGQLEDILEAFKKKCSADDLEQILKNMHAYANEGLNGEDSTHHNYLANLIEGKKNTYQTYLNFMGICFYYHDKKLTNSAWYYYSRAEYFKGIHESWNYIIKHEDAIYFNKNEKNNPEKELSDLDIEISNFLQEKIMIHRSKKPLTLIHLSHFIEDSLQDVYLIMKNQQNKKSRPITDGVIRRSIHRIIRDDSKLNRLITPILK